jgi:hypothetical protein
MSERGASPGVFELTVDGCVVRRLLTNGVWEYSPAPDKALDSLEARGVIVRRSNRVLAVDVSQISRGASSGTCYVLAAFSADSTISPNEILGDSNPMPEWIRSRAVEQLHRGVHTWTDLMAVLAPDSVRVLSEFAGNSLGRLSVNREERFYAMLDVVDRGVKIYDSRTGATLSPSVPSGSDIGFAAFSPDGMTLAAVGRDHEHSAVYVCPAPNFEQFRVLYLTPGMHPIDLAWSPDGEWILLHRLKQSTVRDWHELAAMEVTTGQIVDIPHHYFLNGLPTDEVYIGGGTDWSR